MIIIKSKTYQKDYNKKIKNKHMYQEIETINKIEGLFLDSPNLKSLLLNPLKNIYNIEQKSGNLKQIFTAKINNKIRLYIKPIGEYPYNIVEIEKVEFLKIDDKHYGEG